VLIGGLAVIWPVIGWTDKSKDPKTAFIVFMFALALAITVHEFGHLFAGWIVGFRFHAINLGPFSLNMEHGKLKMHLGREMLAAGSAGMHVRTIRRLRRRLLFFTAGGPVANIVSIPATVVLINYVFPRFVDTPMGALAAQFTVFSLLGAMINLSPINSGVLISDGARIEILLRSRDRARRWLSIAAIGKLYNEGIRPKDWRRTWVKSAASIFDGSMDELAGHWLAYMSGSDQRDARDAGIHMERCLALMGRMPVSVRDQIAHEAAIYVAWFRKDTSLANHWLAQVKKLSTIQRLMQLRLDIAMCCANGDLDNADCAWQAGLTFIETATSGSVQLRLRESWLEWQTEIRELQAQHPIL
jgi:hypothetical protein